MSSAQFKFGMTDIELANAPLVYAPELLKGQRALVSGGGSGIGKAIAWIYARLGAHVIICGREADKLEATVKGLQEHGLSASYLCVNIREPDAVDALMKSVFDDGGLHILVNNAGGQFPQESIDFSPNGWKAVIDTNLNGTWFMMQAAAKRWRDTEQPGNIINIVAVVDNGLPGIAHTCAARAGIIHASKSVAVEWAPFNIQTNCVAPGIIDSEGMRHYSEQARAEFHLSNPMKRLGSTWDVAQTCAYLASGAANFMTGEVLTIDGGGRYWGELWTNGKPDYFST